MRRVALVLAGSRNLNKRTSRFLESLRDSGFDPLVLAVPRRPWGTTGIEDPSLVVRQGVAIMRTAASRSRRSPDLIVCMHWSLLPLATLLKRVFRVSVIYDEHDHYEMLALEATGPAWANRVRSWWVGRVHARCLPRVDLVTCVHLVGGQLQQHLQSGASRVVELHNYPSRQWGERARHRPPSDGSIAIVYSGGVWEAKGCRGMLDAFLLLADDRSLPPLALHVFGQGDPAIERRLKASVGVIFHGSSTYHEIATFMASHDCLGLVLLDATPRYSLVSTNCHKLYEYLAAGAAVLATDVGEIRDIVASLDGGWTIDAGFDAEALADRLREIIAQPQELRRRGDAAAEAVRRNQLWWDGEWEKVEKLGVLGPGPLVDGRDHV